LALLLLFVAAWSLTSGAVETTASETLSAMRGSDDGAQAKMFEVVVREIRMPRVAAGILVGAALSIAGALLQGLFRNPLADPALIGVSSGAAIGGVTALILVPMGIAAVATSSWSPPDSVLHYINLFALPVCAMGCAIALTFAIYRISLVGGRIHVPAMLLTGIAVNAIGGAVVGLMLTVFATDDQMRSVTFWMLGSLSGSNWTSTGLLALIIIPCLILALRYDKSLNSFLLGESEAFHLGVDVNRVRKAVIILSALIVGVTVAFCGIIGFVGLVVPHMIRTLFGPDHRLLLPASALFGGTILLAADVFARTAVSPAELQIGILTSLLGGPFFLALLLSSRKSGASLVG
tara:strand:- start:9632 stop:10678 length:1047 start_codon:yes stop_codon:yes gene_type:complete